jgi:hypothetical protein
VLGVLLGTVPGTVLTAQFGSALGQGRTVLTAVAAVGMAVSVVLGAWLGRKIIREVHARDEAPAPAANEQRAPPARARVRATLSLPPGI